MRLFMKRTFQALRQTSGAKKPNYTNILYGYYFVESHFALLQVMQFAMIEWHDATLQFCNNCKKIPTGN